MIHFYFTSDGSFQARAFDGSNHSAAARDASGRLCLIYHARRGVFSRCVVAQDISLSARCTCSPSYVTDAADFVAVPLGIDKVSRYTPTKVQIRAQLLPV